MRAIGIIEAYTSGENRGQPKTSATMNYVHLMPSLSGNFQSYMVAAPAGTLDALEAEDACIVVMRLTDTDESGALTYAEYDQPHAEIETVFNAFMAEIGQPQFPSGTTPRQILGAFNIDPAGTYIHDAAA